MVETLSKDRAKELLRDAGLRATAPRVAVLQLLAAATRPLSHGEVVEQINSDDWDQATLYRNLLKLRDAGLARVASQIGGIARYEYLGEGDELTHAHPHFSCRKCGTLSCLPEAKLGGVINDRWRRSLEGSELQLIGDCPACLAREENRA